MRKIRLESVLEFGGRADFAITDVTEEKARKRGTITIDYAPSDIQGLKDRGLDYEGALDYYRKRIYDLVKHYISGDWECVYGCDEAMEIIRKHVGPRYE